jgi:hypothetical protein
MPLAATVALPLLPSRPEHDASEAAHDAYDCRVHVTPCYPSCLCLALKGVEKLVKTCIHAANRTALRAVKRQGIVALCPWNSAPMAQRGHVAKNDDAWTCAVEVVGLTGASVT